MRSGNINVIEEKAKDKKIKSPGSLKAIAKREKLEGWIFIAPFIILVSIFFIYPLISAIVLSFKEYSNIDGISLFEAKNVGVQNYFDVLKDKSFIKALQNTTIYALGVVPTQLIIALGLALIVDGKVRFKGFFRTAYYIPTQTSTVAVSIMFLFLLKTDGAVNNLLKIFGIEPYNFFGDPKTALPSIMAMAIWSTIGLYMVIFLAGLQDIPESLYEAATIDGASKWQSFWRITLPMLKPTVFFNLVTSMIGCFQVFDQAYVVSGGNGGPLDSTMTVMLKIYRTGFRDFQMGKAAAMAFVLFAIIFTLTLVQKKLFGEENVM